MQSAYSETAEMAARWILHQRDEFSLPPAKDRSFVTLFKPLAELALAADVLFSWSSVSSHLRQIGWDLLSFCWNQTQHGELMERMILEHPDLVVVASVYLTFHRHGMRNPTLEKAIKQVLHIRGVSALEFPSWRMLEIASACNELELSCPWTVDTTFRGTWLFKKPEPWSMCDSAAYSLTHTVFYKTIFGRRPGDLLGEHTEYLKLWCPLWVHYYYKMCNYDLLGEMIMVMRCVDEPDAADWGLMLATGRGADGMFTGPQGAGRGLDPLTTDPARRLFLDNYHTTLVALMASVMSLAESVRPSLPRVK